MPSTSGHAGDAAANSQTGGHIPSPLQPQPAGSPSPEPPRLRLETSDIPSWGPEGIARPGVKAGPGGPSAELGAGAKRGPAHRQRDWSASPFGKGSIHRSGDQAAPCSQAGGCSGDAPFHLSGTLAHPPASWTPAAGHSEAAGEELCQGAVSARALPSPPPCSSVGTGREAEAIFRRKTNLSLPSRQQGRTRAPCEGEDCSLLCRITNWRRRERRRGREAGEGGGGAERGREGESEERILRPAAAGTRRPRNAALKHTRTHTKMAFPHCRRPPRPAVVTAGRETGEPAVRPPGSVGTPPARDKSAPSPLLLGRGHLPPPAHVRGQQGRKPARAQPQGAATSPAARHQAALPGPLPSGLAPRPPSSRVKRTGNRRLPPPQEFRRPQERTSCLALQVSSSPRLGNRTRASSRG